MKIIILGILLMPLLGVSKEPEQRDLLLRITQCLFSEAKGESYEGKQAVASVIYRRAKQENTSWKRALAYTCRKGQFSCWNKGWPKAPDMRQPAQKQAWYECYMLADQLVRGCFVPTVQATHYHEKGIKPAWRKGLTKVARIGKHIFYI